MISATQSLIIIAVVAFMTALIRFTPELIFRHRTPKAILYLGSVLPFSIMGMLIIYCLKNVNVFEGSRGLPEFISILLVIILHKFKHNTLLSMLLGTLSYMFLIQFVFK